MLKASLPILGMSTLMLLTAEARGEEPPQPDATRWVASVTALRILNQDVSCSDSDACGGGVTQDGPGWGAEVGFGPRLRLSSAFELLAQASLHAASSEADHLDESQVQTHGDSPVSVTTLAGGATLSLRAVPVSPWYVGLGVRGGVYHASGSVDVTTVEAPPRDLTASYDDTAGYYGVVLETGFYLDGARTFDVGARAMFDASGGLGTLSAGVFLGWAVMP